MKQNKIKVTSMHLNISISKENFVIIYSTLNLNSKSNQYGILLETSIILCTKIKIMKMQIYANFATSQIVLKNSELSHFFISARSV